MKQSDNTVIGAEPMHNCPICGSQGVTIHHSLLDRLFDSQGQWNIKRCANPVCELLWLDPMPRKNELWKAYNKYYTHEKAKTNILPFLRFLEDAYIVKKYGYDKRLSKPKIALSSLFYLFPTERAEVDMNIFYVHASYGKRLLDIGCGNGNLMRRLNSRGWSTTGIDFDKKAINYCRTYGLDVFSGELVSHAFRSGEFDVVTLNHVIEHLPNPLETLVECYRILKPGGRLIIATPNSKSWGYRKLFLTAWNSLDPPRHLMIFNRTNLLELLRSAGFSISESRTTIRNEYYVYAASKTIQATGHFAMGQQKPRKSLLIRGKFYQLFVWFLLAFNKDVGGEVLIKAEKNA